MNSILKKLLRPIFYSFIWRWPYKGVKILYHVFIYLPSHRTKYSELKQFKNIHKNDRVFIVATGPSLTLEDVNKLKGEITFGMNSVYKMYDKTDWRPTYYAIFDPTVYQKIKDDITDIEFNCGFVSEKIPWYGKNMHSVPIWDNWRGNTTIEKSLYPDYLQAKQLRVSDDISKYVYAATSVVHFIMQICFYMGFKEIYIIGADCTNANKHSTLTTYKNSHIIGASPDYITACLFRDYERAKKYAEMKGIKIYNATRGGALEKFDRVDLDKIL